MQEKKNEKKRERFSVREFTQSLELVPDYLRREVALEKKSQIESELSYVNNTIRKAKRNKRIRGVPSSDSWWERIHAARDIKIGQVQRLQALIGRLPKVRQQTYLQRFHSACCDFLTDEQMKRLDLIASRE